MIIPCDAFVLTRLKLLCRHLREPFSKYPIHTGLKWFEAFAKTILLGVKAFSSAFAFEELLEGCREQGTPLGMVIDLARVLRQPGTFSVREPWHHKFKDENFVCTGVPKFDNGQEVAFQKYRLQSLKSLKPLHWSQRQGVPLGAVSIYFKHLTTILNKKSPGMAKFPKTGLFRKVPQKLLVEPINSHFFHCACRSFSQVNTTKCDRVWVDEIWPLDIWW